MQAIRSQFAVLVLYLATLQLSPVPASLSTDGVKKYVITRRGRYDSDLFRVIYRSSYNNYCPSDVCAKKSAYVNNTVPCSCSCKGETPTFLPELGKCSNTATVKESLFGNCSIPLGMESRKIKDSQLKSYSQISSAWSPSKGRLNNNRAWCSRSNSVFLEFFEIDLQEVKHVSSIATQGFRGSGINFVRTFRIRYSYDGVSWLFYKDGYGKDKIFSGNSDSQTIKYNYFRQTFETRFLRIYPKSYRRYMCLRVELYGCSGNAVCSRFFNWPFSLKSLNLGNEGSEKVSSSVSYDSCQVVPSSEAYYDYQVQNKWVIIHSKVFKVEVVQGQVVFKWTAAVDKNLLGRIVRVMVNCSYSRPASRPSKTACLVFKTSGQITYDDGTSEKPSMTTVYTEQPKPSKSASVTESTASPGHNGSEGDKDASTSGNDNGAVIGAAVGGVAVFGILLILLVVICKRRKLKNNQQARNQALDNPVYGKAQYKIPVRRETGKEAKTSTEQDSQSRYQDITTDRKQMNGVALYSRPEENSFDNRPVYQNLDKNTLQSPGYQTLIRRQHATAQATHGTAGKPSALPEPVYNVPEKPDMAEENAQSPLYNVLEGPYAIKSCDALHVQDPLYNVLEERDFKQDQQEPLNNVLESGPEAEKRPFGDASSYDCLYNVLEGPDSGGSDNSGAYYAAPGEPLPPGGHDNPSYEQSLEFNVPYASVR